MTHTRHNPHFYKQHRASADIVSEVLGTYTLTFTCYFTPNDIQRVRIDLMAQLNTARFVIVV